MFQFSNYHINYAEWSNKPYWYFNCAMISTCDPAFNKCEDNYDVENVLRKNKVIRKGTKTDTESCALNVMFATERGGENFIKRLNKYLEKYK
jgi:hypothetical protein